MRIIQRKWIFALAFYISVQLFCSFSFAMAQTSPEKKAGIVDITPYSIVSVEYVVQASEKQLVIPVCKENEGDSQFPCMVHLQRIIGGVWKNAQFRKSMGGVLGFYSKEYWKPLLVNPGDKVKFHYGISKESFGIRSGEHLRIVLGVWDSTDSMMKTDYNPDQNFVSPVFVCP
jgi:hypothetical protein